MIIDSPDWIVRAISGREAQSFADPFGLFTPS
jgi:hypothetical protein